MFYLKAIWIDSSIVRFSERICSSLVKLENSFVFEDDNDRKHTGGLVKDWLKQKKIGLVFQLI